MQHRRKFPILLTGLEIMWAARQEVTLEPKKQFLPLKRRLWMAGNNARGRRNKITNVGD